MILLYRIEEKVCHVIVALGRHMSVGIAMHYVVIAHPARVRLFDSLERGQLVHDLDPVIPGTIHDEPA